MSQLGNTIKATIYGESHSDKVGVIIDNLPCGFVVDNGIIQHDLDRRSAKNNLFSTPRKENDKLVVESGMIDGFTSGGRYEAYILNENTKPSSYNNLLITPRPGHADYVARVKYGDSYNASGGGSFSGRMTAPMVIMGSVAKQILARHGILVSAYISRIGDIDCGSYSDDSRMVTHELGKLPIKDISATEQAMRLLDDVRAMGDSIGGKIECIVRGMPAGLGGAMWQGLESRLAYGLYGVPAVKAVEFGSGVDIASMKGSQANDSIYYNGDVVSTRTNHNGGINGGISNGMDISLRVTCKPTPSISIEQDTVNLATHENVKLSVKGRHDCCLLPRAVVVIEAITAFVLLDLMAEEGKLNNQKTAQKSVLNSSNC